MVPLLIASVAATAAGSMMKMQGDKNERTAQNYAADYNQKVMRNNATSARQMALVDESRVRRDNERTLGKTAAAIGASGVTAEGSPLDVLAETASLGEFDALTTRWSGESRARGYDTEAQMAEMRKRRGGGAGQWIGAAAEILGSASSAYGTYQAAQ